MPLCKKCVVPGCESSRRSEPRVSLFLLPRNNAERLDKFLKAINRLDLKKRSMEHVSRCVICEKHFDPGHVVKGYALSRLSKQALPTRCLPESREEPDASTAPQSKVGQEATTFDDGEEGANPATLDDAEDEPPLDSEAVEFKLRLKQLETSDCPNCDVQFSYSGNLHRHMRRVHGIRNYSAFLKASEGLRFAETEQFEAWKRKVEDEDGAFFVVSSSKQIPSGRKSYYVCNRSGVSRMIPDSERKRHSKFIGSCKINANCTAKFTARFSWAGILVSDFRREHCGHKAEPAHLPIPAGVKERIAGQLAAQKPYDYVLDAALRGEPPGAVSRTSLLSKQDIRNIAARYGVEQEGKMDADDGASVKAWVVKERNKGGPSCVLLFKPLGEESLDLGADDFLLAVMAPEQEAMLRRFGDTVVAVDSTRGTASYRFEITTLLVADEFGQAFPAAFMFSNKTDEHFVELFLRAVRERAGPVEPRVFMSEPDDAAYDACRSAWGLKKCEARLYSTWYVLRDWRASLARIRDAGKRSEAWKCVRALLTEPDERRFRQMLPPTLDWLRSDKRTSKFGDYFASRYAGTYAGWACAFRRNVPNARVHIERFHRGLKRAPVPARVPKRLDLTVHNLLRLARRRFAVRPRPETALELKRPESRHDASAALSADDVIPHVGDTWSVVPPDAVNVYEVKLVRSACACASVCPACSACCHMYSCTCHDYVVSANMCKHVHLVCGKVVRGAPTSAPQLAGGESQLDDCEVLPDVCEVVLDESEVQLDDCEMQLEDSEVQLEDSEVQLEDSEVQLEDEEPRAFVARSQLAGAGPLLDDEGSGADSPERCVEVVPGGNADDDDLRWPRAVDNRKAELRELAESIIRKCSSEKELRFVGKCLKSLSFNLEAGVYDMEEEFV